VLRYYDVDSQPKTLNTDKHSSLEKRKAIANGVEQRLVKCLNNGIESDHAPIKKLVVATGGFKMQKRVWSTLQRFESLRMINKG